MTFEEFEQQLFRLHERRIRFEALQLDVAKARIEREHRDSDLEEPTDDVPKPHTVRRRKR